MRELVGMIDFLGKKYLKNDTNHYAYYLGGGFGDQVPSWIILYDRLKI